MEGTKPRIGIPREGFRQGRTDVDMFARRKPDHGVTIFFAIISRGPSNCVGLFLAETVFRDGLISGRYLGVMGGHSRDLAVRLSERGTHLRQFRGWATISTMRRLSRSYAFDQGKLRVTTRDKWKERVHFRVDAESRGSASLQCRAAWFAVWKVRRYLELSKWGFGLAVESSIDTSQAGNGVRNSASRHLNHHHHITTSRHLAPTTRPPAFNSPTRCARQLSDRSPGS